MICNHTFKEGHVVTGTADNSERTSVEINVKRMCRVISITTGDGGSCKRGGDGQHRWRACGDRQQHRRGERRGRG